jgi:HTH-type transcriptional regulator/antitoxin HigA
VKPSEELGTYGEFKPDWALPPGDLLRQVLDQRGFQQNELAERSGLSPKHINQIVKNHIGITGDIAVRLERALGTPASFWCNVDAAWELHKSQQQAAEMLPSWTAWADAFDRPTLRRHDVIGSGDRGSPLVEKLLRWFGVASPDAFKRVWVEPRVQFRRSHAYEVNALNTALWLRLLDDCGDREDLEPYRPAALRKAVRRLLPLTALNARDGFGEAHSVLADAGVLMVFLQEVPGTRISAATRWHGSHRPLIGITGRGKNVDVLWFNLFHEIGHVLLHAKRTTYLDLDLGKTPSQTEAETEANDFAANTLISPDVEPLVESAVTTQQLGVLASQLGVGEAIVAGRHAHLTNNWAKVARLRPSVSDEDLAELENLTCGHS